MNWAGEVQEAAWLPLGEPAGNLNAALPTQVLISNSDSGMRANLLQGPRSGQDLSSDDRSPHATPAQNSYEPC